MRLGLQVETLGGLEPGSYGAKVGCISLLFVRVRFELSLPSPSPFARRLSSDLRKTCHLTVIQVEFGRRTTSAVNWQKESF